METIRIPRITDLVRGEQTCRFAYFKDGLLWYSHDSQEFMFPIPVSDLGDAKLHASERALLLMRWIRKQLEELGRELSDAGSVVD